MFKMTWACGFVLVLLFPQFLSIREIDFSGNVEIDIENELFPRSPDNYCGEEDLVNLSNMGFSNIPPHVIKSDKIRHVNLSLNNLSNIPNSFFREVSNIKCLTLTSNYYSPRKVLDGTNSDSLKTLVLDQAGYRDGYDTIPCKMTGYFPNLETLHLSKIERCVVDDSFEDKLPQLSTLYLMDYGSQRWNYGTGTWDYSSYDEKYEWRLPSTVRHLHLEGTKFDEFTINSLSTLQSLYLDRYNYTDKFNIPYDNNLQVLSCRKCSLGWSAIYKFFQSPRKALRLFDLSHNDVSDLPDNMFQQASNLDSLILSNNKLTKMPDEKILSQLRGLVLSHNRIREFADMKSNSLKLLSLRNNGISRIYNNTFQGLPALQMLDLSENRLVSLPNDWARNLTNLLILNLDSNLFARFADTSLTTASSGLRHLFMKGNLIERFDEQDFQLLPDNCTIYFTSKTFIRISGPSTEAIDMSDSDIY